MSTPLGPWLLVALATLLVFLIMTALWLLGIRNKNFSYVDIGWSANFAVIALLYANFAGGWETRKWIFAAMYALWSLRLAGHLAKRIIGEPEEGRYVELRQRWANNLHAKFFGFFQLQALLNVVLTVPLLIGCINPEQRLHLLEVIGVAIWLVGLICESVADGQLAAFKRSASRGRVCDVGLWRYSRHPNYFFEWTIWIGYAVFALASPWGWVALAMPALMLHFLINVTGIKATEEQALRSKGELYREYQQRTSAFIPLPRKRLKS